MSLPPALTLESSDLPATHDVDRYRPLVLHGSRALDRDILRRLQQSGTVEVHDTFQQQVEGLVCSRTPKRSLTRHELEQAAACYLGDKAPGQAGVWVYYPWRRALVHLLEEADFVELRTSRNRHKLTLDEQRFLATRRVGIIGLSVGGQVAMAMAMERICGELRLADFDVLELSNLNRLREGVFNLGLKKTTLAARGIAEIDPFLKVVCYDAGLTPENLDAFLTAEGRLDVLVDVCDGLAMKLRCREHARRLGIPVVMEANDRATLDIERFDREPTRPILHGLLGDLDLGRVAELRSNEEKVPYVLSMVGEDTMSDKLRASLLEVGESIETWPQLASDVALGAGLVTNVVRRIALEQLRDSGRYFVDLEELVKDRAEYADRSGAPPQAPSSAPSATAEIVLPDESEPDQLELPAADLEALVEAAALAPSGANEQPWKWIERGSALWLLPQSRFGESLLNYRDFGTQLALGAAAENLVLAAQARGLSVKLDRPLPAAPGSPVRFRFFRLGAGRGPFEDGRHRALAAQIGLRHTNRRRAAFAALPAATLSALAAIGDGFPRCRLHLVEDRPAVAEVADVAARAERIRMLHPVGHRDLVREIRWTAEEAESTRDGIDLRTIDLSSTEHAGLRMLRSPGVPELLRRWRCGRGLETMSRAALLSASAVGLVTAPTSDTCDLFEAGRMLERLWLSATELGIALQPLTASVFLFARAFNGGSRDFDGETLGELYGLHARLGAVFGARGAELFLFRLFPACEPPARSLRHPVASVLDRSRA